MKPDWAPAAGEIIWISFDPQLGREQGGHRPAVVLSDVAYNRRIGLCVCVPTTTKIKGYPFEVALAGEPASVALADHLKSFDWRARGARAKAWATAEELAEIREISASLIEDAPV